MKAKVLFGMFLIMSSLFWSCIDVVLNSEEEMNPLETNLITEEINLKSGTPGKQILLRLKNEEPVGTITLSNNATSLKVKFEGNSNYNLEEVQLWVGTDPYQVPSNIQNMPIPGKFPYKSSGDNEYLFDIILEQIEPDYKIAAGKDIYLFAHANAINKYTGILESAWSEGEFLPTDLPFLISYSIYTPTGGGGCFSHLAFCGELIDNNYYYNINNESENIVADNGEIVGTASYIDQNIRFNFNQDWMFSDNTPRVVIHGYNKPGGKAFTIYSGNPLNPDPPIYYYYGPLTKYRYYTIQLNVQHCTTSN